MYMHCFERRFKNTSLICCFPVEINGTKGDGFSQMHLKWKKQTSGTGKKIVTFILCKNMKF